MAKNPNELSKILNEMTNALQELSDSQLESVQSILANQKDLIAKEKKVKKAKDKLEKEKKAAKEKDAKDTKSIIEKTLEQKDKIMSSFDSDVFELKEKVSKKKKAIKSLADRLGTSLVDGMGLRSTFDAYKSIKGALSNPKEFLKDRIFGTEDKSKISSILTIKKDLVLSNSNINNMNIGLKGDLKLNGSTINGGTQKTSQSLLNFDAETEDISSQQLEVMNEINGKLDKLGVTGQSGGLFDFMSNGIKDLAMSYGAEAAGGAGATAILAKYGKKIPGLSKIKSIASSAKAIPKSKVGLGIAAASALGIGGYALSNDETPVEPRIAGGKVEKGKPYVVGEGGKELFVPNTNGTIIPNEKSFALTKNDISKLKLSQTNRAGQFVDNIKEGLSAYNKPYTNSLTSYFKTFNKDYVDYKEEVKIGFSNILDMVGNVWDGAKTAIGGTFDAIDAKAKGWVGVDAPPENGKSGSPSPSPSLSPSKPQGDAPEAKVSGSIEKEKPVSSTQTIPQKVIAKNDYKIPSIVEPNVESNEKAKVVAFLEGFKETLQLTPEYKPAVRSNIVSDTWGNGNG